MPRERVCLASSQGAAATASKGIRTSRAAEGGLVRRSLHLEDVPDVQRGECSVWMVVVQAWGRCRDSSAADALQPYDSGYQTPPPPPPPPPPQQYISSRTRTRPVLSHHTIIESARGFCVRMRKTATSGRLQGALLIDSLAFVVGHGVLRGCPLSCISITSISTQASPADPKRTAASPIYAHLRFALGSSDRLLPQNARAAQQSSSAHQSPPRSPCRVPFSLLTSSRCYLQTPWDMS
jgi:hypothetical protein